MNQKMILLVEDNPDDEALALRALSRNNPAASIHVVRDGAQGVDVTPAIQLVAVGLLRAHISRGPNNNPP